MYLPIEQTTAYFTSFALLNDDFNKNCSALKGNGSTQLHAIAGDQDGARITNFNREPVLLEMLLYHKDRCPVRPEVRSCGSWSWPSGCGRCGEPVGAEEGAYFMGR
jgi:hypothetical protein